jgi:hypothetical protein
MEKTHNSQLIIPLVLLSISALLIIQRNLAPASEQHFVLLAKSFLEGNLHFIYVPGNGGDTALFNGRHFWPLGPLPAVLLMPFVALFEFEMRQGYLAWVFHLLNLFLLYRIARQITGKTHVALWLSFAYAFGTVYFYIIFKSWSWYFAQTIATSFVLLALHEYFFKRRWWLIGSYLALGVLTRVNVLIAAVFFGLCILYLRDKKQKPVSHLIMFASPIALAVLLLLLYNYARFDNIFEFGYNFQLIFNEPAANREHGLWSIAHFPANLYYFLFKGPDGVFLPGSKILTYPFLKPDIWGMSIVLTSPILLWGLAAPWEDRVSLFSVLTSLTMLFALLGYYGIGVRQYGYRYALDLYPFLFILLAKRCKTKFTIAMQVVIVLSFLFNWYLIRLV